MTLLPPALERNPIPSDITKPALAHANLKPKEENWQHNWLYSVIPAAERVSDWRENGDVVVSYPLRAYLTGYCRNCRRVFSQSIPTDIYGYAETQTNVPVYGCVAPERV